MQYKGSVRTYVSDKRRREGAGPGVSEGGALDKFIRETSRRRIDRASQAWP